MKYGKMAVIAAIGTFGISDKDIDVTTIDTLAKEKIEKVGSLWGDFINYVSKKPANGAYILEDSLDLDVYYKGRTVNGDIKSFF